MSKTTHPGTSRLLLSLSLIGLLCFYAAPKSLAQDAPPNSGSDQAPASQAPPNDQNDQNPPAQAPPNDQNPPPPAPGDQPLTNAPNAAAPPAGAPGADQGGPPSRAARISYLEGSISLQPGGEGDWGNAVKNRPVTIGDKIWVDKNSRAELESGQATFHLGSMTALSFLNLDGPVTQVRLPEGSVNFRIREMREGDIYEVDTPNAAFMVKQAGAYRIDVSEAGDGTRVTAIRGEGEVTAGGKTYPIHPFERAEFINIDDNIAYTAHGAPPPDGLDRWANDRDLRQDNSTSSRYVNRDVPGAEDLDDNGTWSEQPDVGPVWTPNNVPPDWAPYSDGSWNYVGPWGWSWVGYEPWGFAPYHYGRWGFYGGRWGWCPGPIWAPPFYGPAFVGFLGGGFGFGVGFGFGFRGGIGWFPLGFGEPFHPWYHAGAGYIHNINIHNTVIRNTTVINSHNFNYAYAHNEHAVTAASRNAFMNGDRVNRGATHLTSASLRNAQVTNAAGVSPTRASFSGAAATTGRSVATPPSSVQNRSVMTRTTPSAAANQPFRSVNSASLANNRDNSSGSNSSVRNSSVANSSANAHSTGNSANVRSAGNSSTRTWSAQGNVTDHGTAPRGAGRYPSTSSNSAQTAHVNQSNRPEWARAGATNTSRPNGNSTANSSNRPATSYANRSSSAPANRASAPSRSYSAPRPSYSAPSRTYSAPASHAPSAPSGGGSRGGSSGGGGSHAGGGGSAGHH